MRQLVTLDPPPGNKRMLFLGSHSPFLFSPGIQPTGRHCLPLGCVCPVHLNLSGNPLPAQPRGVSHQLSKRSLTVRSLMKKGLCQSHSTGLTVTISKDLIYKKTNTFCEDLEVETLIYGFAENVTWGAENGI